MRPNKGMISPWSAAVMGLIVAIVAILSITRIQKLTNTPPADFLALRASVAGPKTAMAARYWVVAVRVIRWKYSSASELPEQVPADFRLAD